MKKKLLTVLLAVVMVFGVFGLTACGSAANPDAEYNYYGIKYELEDEVKIEAVTFQGVYKMFTTPGRFLLYVDSETSSTVKADMQAINKLANEWGVTIYHFNPDLTGGYAKTETTANANVIKVTESDTQNLKTIRDELVKVSNAGNISKWTDSSLVGIIGAESTVSRTNALQYNGKISAVNSVDKAVDTIVALCRASYQNHSAQNPSYGAYTDEKGDIPKVPEAYVTSEISTMNLFGDARLHMYNDDNGVDALTDEKTDLYVTVANYEMFAYLLDNNEGYFPVFFGGTWCPNTQAIAKLTNEVAKDYGVEKIYFFDPKLADGTRTDALSSTTTFSYEKYLEDSLAIEIAKEKGEITSDEALAAMETAGYTTTYSIVKNSGSSLYNFNTRDNDSNCEWAYAYASFLDEYLSSYNSEWNIGVTLSIGGKKYTRMCVPNIMMFNGEGEGSAELIALAEAEYRYEQTSIEGSPTNVAWTNAVKAVFDANPYLTYNPVEEEVVADTSSSSAAGSSSSSSSDSGSAC